MVAEQSFNDYLRINEVTYNGYKSGLVPFEKRLILVKPQNDICVFFFGFSIKKPNILPYTIALYNFN